jgi:hypothetical protein
MHPSRIRIRTGGHETQKRYIQSTNAMDHIDEKTPEAEYHGLKDQSEKENTKVPLIALQDDFHRVAGQSYAVVSFIDGSTYGGARVDGQICAPMHLLKIRGVFSSKLKADAHALKLQQLDPYFDVHIVPTFKWTSVGATMASDTKYGESAVADVMEDYFETEDEVLSNMHKRMQLNRDGVERGDDTNTVYDQAVSATSREDYESAPANLTFEEMGVEMGCKALQKMQECI